MPHKDVKLIEARNKKLIERYYYWSEVKRRRFDDVINILKYEEFFIGEAYIMKILSANDHYLQSLLKSKPNAIQLKLYDEN